MGVFFRKVRTAFVVLAVVIVGGGFASADTSAQHDVTYEILSFRAVSLSSADPVPFGYVRQGQVATTPGPTLLYATTWGNDKIVASLNSDTTYGVILSVTAGSPTAPPSSPTAAPSDGGPACFGFAGSNAGNAFVDVPLSSSTPQAIIDGIQDCGIDAVGYWIQSPLTFTIDASNANNEGLMTAGPQTKTITYTIQAG